MPIIKSQKRKAEVDLLFDPGSGWSQMKPWIFASDWGLRSCAIFYFLCLTPLTHSLLRTVKQQIPVSDYGENEWCLMTYWNHLGQINVIKYTLMKH